MSEWQVIVENGIRIGIPPAGELLLWDRQSALDLLANASYLYDCHHLAVAKELIHEDFFRLSSGLAGEILQRFINYQLKMAIYGDFSHYTSKPLQDFIRESNQGQHFFFLPSREEALQKLAQA